MRPLNTVHRFDPCHACVHTHTIGGGGGGAPAARGAGGGLAGGNGGRGLSGEWGKGGWVCWVVSRGVVGVDVVQNPIELTYGGPTHSSNVSMAADKGEAAEGEEEAAFTPHVTLFKTSKDRDAVAEANKYVRPPTPGFDHLSDPFPPPIPISTKQAESPRAGAAAAGEVHLWPAGAGAEATGGAGMKGWLCRSVGSSVPRLSIYLCTDPWTTNP